MALARPYSSDLDGDGGYPKTFRPALNVNPGLAAFVCIATDGTDAVPSLFVAHANFPMLLHAREEDLGNFLAAMSRIQTVALHR